MSQNQFSEMLDSDALYCANASALLGVYKRGHIDLPNFNRVLNTLKARATRRFYRAHPRRPAFNSGLIQIAFQRAESPAAA